MLYSHFTPGNQTIQAALDATLDIAGNATTGKAVTATLRVNPDGDGTDGLSWATAYQTIQAALDAASTDGDALTLILVSPHATNYNIDTTGDPTWAANVILQGAHRNWAKIVNDHGSASSVLKLTGKSSVSDLNINLGTGNNGLIMTHGGCRVYRTQFVGEDLAGAATALWLDHATGGKHAKVVDVDILGDGGTHCTGVKCDQFGRSRFDHMRIHACLTAIHIVGANSDENIWNRIDAGDNALGIDIDAGNEQHFYDFILHHNTRNVDDEVGDHIWANMHGAFPIYLYPANMTGTNVPTGAAVTYGADTELIAAAAFDFPFRIVSVHFEPDDTDLFQVRFSADSGSTFYDEIHFEGNRRVGTAAPSGTEFIFNKGTRISCSARNRSGGDNVLVWLGIQEI